MIDLSQLKTTLPDLDTLIDKGAAFKRDDPFSVCHRDQARKVRTFDGRKTRHAIDLIQAMPEPGEYLHVIVSHNFAGFDLVPAFLTLAKADRYSALWMTTLGFSRDNLAQLGTMIDAGQIPPADLKILCGDFFRRADSGLWAIGKILAQEKGFGFRSARNHTKLIMGEIAGKFYVVESSANLRSCHNIELFAITQSRELFEFHTAWISEAWKGAKE